MGAKTILRVTVKITNPFPDNIPELRIESGGRGWKFLLKDKLKNYLES